VKDNKETSEKNCVQRFLNWYNEQHKRNYTYQRATERFPALKGKLNWDFVAYAYETREEWIGIEVKELPHLKEVDIWFEFWRGLCSKLTRDLSGKGIQGEFGIIIPPVFELEPEERSNFREAFTAVLCQKALNMKIDEMIDIGPDIAAKFANWPKDKSNPSELQITKISDSGCEVESLTSPIRAFSVPEKHKEAFNKVFKLKNDAIPANKQLKLAKEKGATQTILLLCCNAFVKEGLIKNEAQNLDRHSISDIDYIYLVDIGNKDRVVKIYPSS